MKNKDKSTINKKKTPISIILITVWMGFMAIRTLAKLINLERLELNKNLLGSGFAIFNYVTDTIILIALIILIVLFILRKKNTWKYFIVLMVVLIIGVMISFFYISLTIDLFPSESQSFISIVIFLFFIVLILFYIFLTYVVYGKRGYFVK